MKKIIIATLFALIPVLGLCKQHKATVWGVKSDGLTDNTASIQRAIDYLSEHGGDTLVFYVGRYLTGAIELKSNVTIRLCEGAVLVAAPNIYAFNGAPALIWAKECENISVLGHTTPGRGGVIEGSAAALNAHIEGQKAKGLLTDSPLPALISFENCANARIEDIKLWDSPAAQAIVTSGDVTVKDVYIHKDGIVTTPDGRKAKVIK
ncbi:MAG: endopygalactorunase [Bacteroidales bacterium]|nr:endopygalactorunase [Bacteroidales bacterium]